MSLPIQVKRGLKADLPILLEGEFGFCTDTKEIYIGNGITNTLSAQQGIQGIQGLKGDGLLQIKLHMMEILQHGLLLKNQLMIYGTQRQQVQSKVKLMICKHNFKAIGIHGLLVYKVL